MAFIKRFIFILVIIICFGGIVAFAQNTTPSTEEMNACDVGGVWEGKCDWPTEAEREWAWTCGWYIARYEAGTIAETPTWCNYSTVVPLPPIAPSVPFGCFDALDSGDYWLDFKLIGALNTTNNMEFYHSQDGTCTDPWPYSFSYFIVTIAGSPIPAEIDAACNAVSPGALRYVSAPHIATPFPDAPNDWYLCKIP